MTPVPEADLSPGELPLLDDAWRDDVAFVWILIHLDLLGDGPDWRPGAAELDAAFMALERLQERGLIDVGRTEYIDGGPPGRVAPVRHVAEPLSVVWERVEAAIASANKPTDWEFSCWVVATDQAPSNDRSTAITPSPDDGPAPSCLPPEAGHRDGGP